MGAELDLEPLGGDKFALAYFITPRSPAVAEARAEAWGLPMPEPEEWPDIAERMTLIVFDREAPLRDEASRTWRGHRAA